jgi:hypothetical protein
MTRSANGHFLNVELIKSIGLTTEIFKSSIDHTYNLLDRIDATLLTAGADPLSLTVELANLSSMLGNIFAAAVASHSHGLLKRNGPHKYPDLLPSSLGVVPPIEIKVALELNKPKGHLAKEGWYVTVRYVLCDADVPFIFEKGNRGATAFIWELRLGLLTDAHFNISNTQGDSGKTAVVNGLGMEALKIIYVDLDRAPVSTRARIMYEELIAGISHSPAETGQ